MQRTKSKRWDSRYDYVYTHCAIELVSNSKMNAGQWTLGRISWLADDTSVS